MTDVPPIWVISLERAGDRRAFVEQEFRKLGTPVEIIDAVDGQTLGPSDLGAYSEWRSLFEYGEGLTPGALGCSLSHLRVYEKMLEQGLDELVVVEDDVKPTPDLLRILRTTEEFPSDWQVVTLHSLFDTSMPVPVDDRIIAGRFRVCRYARTPFGTQAYVINASGARRALRAAYPVCLPADELLYRRHPAGLVVYGIEPTAVAHEDFESELHRTSAPLLRSGAPWRPVHWSVRAVGAVYRRASRRRWASRD